MSRHIALKQAIPALRFYAVFLTVLTLAISLPSAKASLESDIPCAPNTLVISFQPGVISFPPEIDYGDNEFVLPFQDAEFTIPQLEGNLYQVGVLSFETIAPEWRHLKDEDYYDRHGNRIPLVDFTNTYKVKLDMSHGLDINEVIEVLEGNPGIDYVECDEVGTTFHTPNDSLYSVQWNLNNTGQDWPSDDCVLDVDINAPEAWDIWDSAGTKIGILDKGIRADHEDLRAFIDSSLSKSWVDGLEWYENPYDHGTRVAGIAAAGVDNDSIGIAGVANLPPTHDDKLIVSLRIIGGFAAGGDQDSVMSTRAYNALAYVCGKGVYPKILVANNSWGIRRYQGCHAYNKTMRNAFRNAFYKDISLVCASGNGEECMGNACETPDLCVPYPAAFSDYCLAVAGVGCDGKALDNRHVGPYIDIAAPGEDVYFADRWTTDSYGAGNGTSFAAPHAAGAIALMMGLELESVTK